MPHAKKLKSKSFCFLDLNWVCFCPRGPSWKILQSKNCLVDNKSCCTNIGEQVCQKTKKSNLLSFWDNLGHPTTSFVVGVSAVVGLWQFFGFCVWLFFYMQFKLFVIVLGCDNNLWNKIGLLLCHSHIELGLWLRLRCGWGWLEHEFDLRVRLSWGWVCKNKKCAKIKTIL